MQTGELTSVIVYALQILDVADDGYICVHNDYDCGSFYRPYYGSAGRSAGDGRRGRCCYRCGKWRY